MDDLTSLLTAVDSFADRLRALPQSRLSRGAAAEGLELARELAERARRFEEPDSPGPRDMPDAGLFAAADQVAVAGHDAVEALRGAPAAEVEDAIASVEAAAKRCGL
ncbi:hypothetical protein [Streptomyces varsoviensis]|uniref:hypothetical protein n=1 Tax=Streptomyces varsoviensis TaxID=67373 RepID=UPI000998C215|nr:hypothetical protein [Streptomyces varsoviensis]